MKEQFVVERLENQLVETLRPIEPRVEFVNVLGHRVRELRRNLLDAGSETWKFFLIIFFGFLSLGFLLALILKGLNRLFGVRK